MDEGRNPTYIFKKHSTHRLYIRSQLSIPNFKDKQSGKVIVTLNIANRIDQILAEHGFISPEEIRDVILTDIVADTKVTLLCLLLSVITQLGLVQRGEASIETCAGVKKGRIFGDIELFIEGRQSTLSCLELTEESYTLLGFIPMLALGLEPDFPNH